MSRPLTSAATAAAALALLASAPAAQTFDEVLQEVRWSFDENGVFQVAPDPSTGDPAGGPGPVVRFEYGGPWQSLGLLGWASIALHGHSDLLGWIDAGSMVEKLGIDEQEVVARLSRPPAATASRRERLEYRVLLHAAEQRGLQPAIGPLRAVAADEDGDPALRRAARCAVANLRGQPLPALDTELLPLAGVLAASPSGAVATVVVEHHRMATPWQLMDLAERTGLLVTRQMIELAGGSLSSPAVAGAVMMSAGPGVLGYALAERIGNQRLDRTVVGVELDTERMEPRFWLHLEGEFDLAALTDGLESLGVATAGGLSGEGADSEVQADLPGGYTLRAGPRRAVISAARFDAGILGAEGAEAMLEDMKGLEDLPVRVVLGEIGPVQGELSQVVELLPDAVGLRPSYGPDGELVLRARVENENVATALEGQVRGLPRMLEAQLDELDLPERAYEMLDRFSVLREGPLLETRVPLWIPEDEVLRELLDQLR